MRQPDFRNFWELPKNIDVTGLQLAEPDLLAIMLRSLPEAVRNFVLHHAGGDTYQSFRSAAQRWEQQQRMFQEFHTKKGISQVVDGAEWYDVSGDTEYHIEAVQGDRCGKCGSRKHSSESCQVDLAKVKCFRCQEFGHVGLNCPKNRESGKGKKGFSKGVQKGDRFEKGKSKGKSSKGSGSKGKSGKGFGKKGKLNEVSWNEEDSWWYDNEWDPHEHDWSWGVEQVGWNEGFYDNDWTWNDGSNWNEAAVWNETKGSEETGKHVEDEKNGSKTVGSLTLHAIFHESFCEEEFSHVGSLCLQPFGRLDDDGSCTPQPFGRLENVRERDRLEDVSLRPQLFDRGRDVLESDRLEDVSLSPQPFVVGAASGRQLNSSGPFEHFGFQSGSYPQLEVKPSLSFGGAVLEDVDSEGFHEGGTNLSPLETSAGRALSKPTVSSFGSVVLAELPDSIRQYAPNETRNVEAAYVHPGLGTGAAVEGLLRVDGQLQPRRFYARNVREVSPLTWKAELCKSVLIPVERLVDHDAVEPPLLPVPDQLGGHDEDLFGEEKVEDQPVGHEYSPTPEHELEDLDLDMKDDDEDEYVPKRKSTRTRVAKRPNAATHEDVEKDAKRAQGLEFQGQKRQSDTSLEKLEEDLKAEVEDMEVETLSSLGFLWLDNSEPVVIPDENEFDYRSPATSPLMFDECVSSIKFHGNDVKSERIKLCNKEVLLWHPTEAVDDTTLIPLDPALTVEGMREEIRNMTKCCVGRVVSGHDVELAKKSSVGLRVIPARWVTAFKTSDRVRARVVAKDLRSKSSARELGFSSPTPSCEILHIVLSIASEKGWRMRSLDVSHAFMHSPLPGQVRIILKLPQSISTLTGELAYLDLLRSLNGLRDASLHWLQLLSSTITHLGLWADEYEPCCYQGHVYDGDVVLGTVILVVYVDDILMCSSSRSAEEKVVQAISAVVPTKTTGCVLPAGQGGGRLQFIGRTIERTFGVCLGLGRLLWLSQTRADVKAWLSLIGSQQSKPTQGTEAALKAVLRFLFGDGDVILELPSTSELLVELGSDGNVRPAFLQVFTDASHAPYRFNNRKGVSGQAIFFKRSLIRSVSKQQQATALSSCEAELYGLQQATQDATAMSRVVHRVLWGIGDVSEFDEPLIQVESDSSSALQLVQGLDLPRRSRHIEIRLMWLRSQVSEGHVVLKHHPGVTNIADIFTKCLGTQLFERHRLALGFRHRDFPTVDPVLSLDEEELFLVEELQVGGIALVEVCCEPESSLSVESLRRGHRYIGVVKDVQSDELFSEVRKRVREFRQAGLWVHVHVSTPCSSLPGCLVVVDFESSWKARALGLSVGVDFGKDASSYPPGRMSMDEYKQLGGLLQKARDESRLGEILVFAKETLEQLQRYQQPIAMPKSKARASAGAASSTAGDGGAMTDASKRRLPEDPEWDDAELVMDAEDVARLIAEQQAPSYTGDVEPPVPFEGSGYGQGLNAEVDRSWFPALSYDDLDLKSVTSTAMWGNTVCVLPKWKSMEWTYEHMTRLALSGSREMMAYLKWLKATYAQAYLERGPKSPGIDMAGFLGRLKFMENPDNLPVEGFNRVLANQ
eukprot:symbB.v1.2.033549.t1/scaffold4184.1/size56758/3